MKCSLHSNYYIILNEIMEKAPGQKEMNLLLYCGYKFRKDRILAGNNVAWRSLKRNCWGRLRVSVTGNVISVSKHNHESVSDQNESKKDEINHIVMETPCQLIPQISTARSSLVVAHNTSKPTACASIWSTVLSALQGSCKMELAMRKQTLDMCHLLTYKFCSYQRK